MEARTMPSKIVRLLRKFIEGFWGWRSKMFKKIIILLKDGLEIDTKSLSKIQEIFSKSETKTIAFNEVKKSDLIEADLIITLGGDGTFVKAANLIEDSFILGINAEPDNSEGALMEIHLEEVDKLREIVKGNFEEILRQRVKVKLNGKALDEHAINEV